MTKEQDSSTIQSSDDPEGIDICTPQIVQEKKKKEQSVTLIPREKQNTRISSKEASNQRQMIGNYLSPTVFFDTFYKVYIEFKQNMNVILNSFNTNNMKHSKSNKSDEEKIRSLESEIKRLNYENWRLIQENIWKGKSTESLINCSIKEKDVLYRNNWVDMWSKSNQTAKRKEVSLNNHQLQNNWSCRNPVDFQTIFSWFN